MRQTYGKTGEVTHPGSRRRVPTLERAIREALACAWEGERVERHFRGALELAPLGDGSLVLLGGECIGEVFQDSTAMQHRLPPGSIRVYQEFHVQRRFHCVSSPRRYAPGFERSLGWFPSAATAALSMLEAELQTGSLRRFERDWRRGRRALAGVSFSTASVLRPWCRVTRHGREIGRLVFEGDRPGGEGRWRLAGTVSGELWEGRFETRDEAALALVAGLDGASANREARFVSSLKRKPREPGEPDSRGVRVSTI